VGFWYNGAASEVKNTVISIPTIISTTTGKTWMDRNLAMPPGSKQVVTDTAMVTPYHQRHRWHQLRTSTTTATLSSVVLRVTAILLQSYNL
jgi:hypothetical protein